MSHSVGHEESGALGGSRINASYSSPNVYDDEYTLKLFQERLSPRRHLGALTVARAAERQGASIQWFDTWNGWAVLPDRRIPLSSHFGPETDVSSTVVGDKQLTKDLLLLAGVGVPEGRVVYTAEEALATHQSIEGPVVLKPLNGAMGNGVTVGVDDAAGVLEGFERARAYGRAVIVEQFVEGFEYRAHATASECVGIFRRLLPSVVGDGVSSIAQLIELKNQLRKANPTTSGMPIPIDELTDLSLQRQGMTVETIPDSGQRVVVRDINGITSGGDSEGCFDTIDDSVKETAVAAVAAIPGMTWAGVDIVVDDRTGKSYVIEINTNAAIDGSNFPVFGTPRDLGGELWSALYANSSPEVTGTSKIPPLVPDPVPMLADQTKLRGEVQSLKQVWQDELRRRGHHVTERNARVWTSESQGGPVYWHSGVLGAHDLRIANQALRRRVLWLRALAARNIPRLIGRRINTLEQLEAFRKQVEVDVTVLPGGTHGSTGEAVVVRHGSTIDEATLISRKNWYVQVRRDGTRLRVYASEAQALLVSSRENQPRPDRLVVESACRVAVRAVRAMPQLRWAAVDVVVRNDGERLSAFVEEMSFRPSIYRTESVVAGSLNQLFDVLRE